MAADIVVDGVDDLALVAWPVPVADGARYGLVDPAVGQVGAVLQRLQAMENWSVS
jgi:hypothetical protein